MLAEIAPANGARPRRRRRTRRRAPPATRRRPAEADGRDRRHRHARRRRVGHRGHDPRVGRQGRRRGRRRRDDRRDLDRQGRHGASRPGRRHDHRDPRRGGRHGHRRPGHRAHAARRAGAPPRRGAADAGAAQPATAAAAPAPAAAPERRQGLPSPRASPPPRASTSARVTGTGPGGRITKADVLDGRDNGAAAPAAAGAERTAAQGRRGDARPLHGRVALDPDRDLVPHDHRHDDGRAPQAAQGRRPEGLLHPPHRLRDRPRRDRGDAGDGPPLRRRSTASRTAIDDGAGQPRHRGRRREEGRQPHADGPGHPRRRPPELPRLHGRLRRPDRQGAREQAHRRRPHGRQRLSSPTRAASARSPRSRG